MALAVSACARLENASRRSGRGGLEIREFTSMRAAWLTLGVVLFGTGCGDQFHAAPSAAGASGGPVAGGAGAGGTGGNGGSSTAGAGMVGGAGAATCACAPGQYCRAGACRDCSDLSSLEFGAPERILADADETLRFPREGESAGALFFRRGADAAARLWYSADYTRSAPVAIDPAATLPQSGLVYLGSAGVRGFNVLFDQTGEAGRRTIRSGRFDGGLTDVRVVGAPLAPGAFDMYGAAFAVETERAYYMSTRDGAATLRTGTLGGDSEVLVELMLPGQGGGACPRSGADATPWVTPDGRLLLFRAPPVAADCSLIAGERNDLYVVPLDQDTGEPLGTAIALDSVNERSTLSDDTDPSFSADLCTLYFASSAGDRFDLYGAPRR